MPIQVNCPNCHTPLKLSWRASSFRCPDCNAINQKGSLAPNPTPYSQTTSFNSFNGNNNNYAPPLHNQAPPSAYGKKKALLIGITNKNTKYELKGCINDTKSIKNMLINRFKFPESSILMLTEEEADQNRIPIKQNIRMAMHWLVQGCQPGDSLVFHYSGHGSQMRDYKGDEVDGYDETICPLDFKTHGMIIDNEINAKIVRPLPPGVKLHAIIDACHSGTALDLPYLCRINRNGRYVWEDHHPITGEWKGTRGEAIFFSSCDDDQLSVDTDVSSKGNPTGVMTFAFIQAIERGKGTTYGSMLNAIRSTIRRTYNLGKGGGRVTKSLMMLLSGGSAGAGRTQEPLLSASETFDVYAKQFSL